METDFVAALRVAVDPEPDERGNVFAAALCRLQRTIALSFNVN